MSRLWLSYQHDHHMFFNFGNYLKNNLTWSQCMWDSLAFILWYCSYFMYTIKMSIWNTLRYKFDYAALSLSAIGFILFHQLSLIKYHINVRPISAFNTKICPYLVHFNIWYLSKSIYICVYYYYCWKYLGTQVIALHLIGCLKIT